MKSYEMSFLPVISYNVYSQKKVDQVLVKNTGIKRSDRIICNNVLVYVVACQKLGIKNEGQIKNIDCQEKGRIKSKQQNEYFLELKYQRKENVFKVLFNFMISDNFVPKNDILYHAGKIRTKRCEFKIIHKNIFHLWAYGK